MVVSTMGVTRHPMAIPHMQPILMVMVLMVMAEDLAAAEDLAVAEDSAAAEDSAEEDGDTSGWVHESSPGVAAGLLSQNP
jgi:hypothetical protein